MMIEINQLNISHFLLLTTVVNLYLLQISPTGGLIEKGHSLFQGKIRPYGRLIEKGRLFFQEKSGLMVVY